MGLWIKTQDGTEPQDRDVAATFEIKLSDARTVIDIAAVIHRGGRELVCVAGFTLATALAAPTVSTAEPSTPADQEYCNMVSQYLAAQSVPTSTTCETLVNVAKIGCNTARAERAKGRDAEQVAASVANSVKVWSDSTTLALAIFLFGTDTYCPGVIE